MTERDDTQDAAITSNQGAIATNQSNITTNQTNISTNQGNEIRLKRTIFRFFQQFRQGSILHDLTFMNHKYAITEVFHLIEFM